MPINGLYTMEEVDFRNRKVFLRNDLNVPVDEAGNILDSFRIKESIPTIRKLFQKGASQVIIATHLGRPNGKEQRYMLDQIARKIYLLTGRRTEKMSDCIGLEGAFPSPKEAQIVVLENLRFHEEEELNDEEFAEKLSKHADIYVNDAFGVCHRAHASVDAITKFLPGCIGLLVEKELRMFQSIVSEPEHPVVAIIGGAKLETKLPIIMSMIQKVDYVLLGGAMIFTFYKAMDYDIGKSMYSKEYLINAKMILNNDKLVLPVDVVVADDKDYPTNITNISPKHIPSYLIGLDIGNESVKRFKEILSQAKTVIWNGPLGYYENPKFSVSTNEIINYLARNPQIKSVIGGGDTASAVEKLKLQDKFYHVSTGGGASLTLLEGKTLKALDALRINTEIFKKRGA